MLILYYDKEHFVKPLQLPSTAPSASISGWTWLPHSTNMISTIRNIFQAH